MRERMGALEDGECTVWRRRWGRGGEMGVHESTAQLNQLKRRERW